MNNIKREVGEGRASDFGLCLDIYDPLLWYLDPSFSSTTSASSRLNLHSSLRRASSEKAASERRAHSLAYVT